MIPSHLCLKYAWSLILLIIAETSDQQREQEKEEKKKYLLRKLSFRPSVDELKTRKVKKIVHPLRISFLVIDRLQIAGLWPPMGLG